MKKTSKMLVVAAIATLALSGCVRIHSTNTFSADGTVNQDMTVASKPEAREYMDIGVDDFNQDDIPGVPAEKVKVEAYEQDDYKGVRVTATGLTLDEFNSANTADGALGSSTPANAVLEDGIYTVTLPVNASENLMGEDAAMMTDMLDFEVKYVFPGEVTSSTAGTVSGNSVVFKFSDISGQDEIVIVAKADGSSSSNTLLIVLLVILALVVIGAVLFLLNRKPRNLTEVKEELSAVAEEAKDAVVDAATDAREAIADVVEDVKEKFQGDADDASSDEQK